MSNALEPLFNLVWDAGALILKSIFKTEKQFNVEEFFKICNLKNSKDEFPILYKKIRIENGTKYLLTIPLALSLKDFKKHQEALEQNTNTNITMIYNNGLIEITSTIKIQLLEIYPYEKNIPAGPIRNGIIIPLGYSLYGIEYVALKTNPHSYIVGSTGGGKSVCMKSILTYLITNYKETELELYLGDLKYVELSLFKKCNIVKQFHTNVENTTQMIRNLLNETEERYRIFETVGLTNIFDYNKKFPNKKMKFQILVIEEVVNLLQDNKKKAMKLLKRLISISRSAGLYAIFTTQRPSADIIDVIVKANISNRIVFHTESEKDSIIALDEIGAEKLDIPGRGILKIGSKKVIFQGFFIEDSEVKKLIEPYVRTQINASESNTNKRINNQLNSQKIDTKENAKNVKDLSFLDNI